MPVYKAPVEDTMFILRDVLGYERYSNLAGFSDASIDLVEAVLGEAAKMAENVMFPLNQSGDQQGCKRGADGSVSTPDGFKAAYDAYCEG
ncbi:MAG: acyl-CoA dehydrogenase, partial [Phyllobacteriaceae bacterium]|nr:acyl-CoA dehydrogenase [Phyllobacteriaceae bacterium]